jgi:hypothetical protein
MINLRLFDYINLVLGQNMTNPNQNPNRRRRLTADELIAIVVAFAGIGTVFFWGIGQKYRPMNLLQGGIANLSGDNPNRKVGLLGGDEPIVGQQERRTIASIAERDRPSPTPTTTPSSVAPTTKTTEESETTTTAPIVPPTVSVPAEVIPTAPVAIAPIPPTEPVPTAPVATAPVFTDVTKQFWGATYISALQKRGILDDFGTGKFDPSKPITRGEYAKMLDRAFPDQAATAKTSRFKDIPKNYPGKAAIDRAVQRGFMIGYSPDKFSPNQQIPRYQLQISLVKGMQLKTPGSNDKALSKFTDATKVPKYAREKMSTAVAAGLVIKDKTQNLLKPNKNATRADAAALIYEALVKEGKIQSQQQP